MEDEITRETIAVREGEVTNPRLRDILGLPPLAEPEATAEPEAAPEGVAEREDELPPISLDDDDD